MMVEATADPGSPEATADPDSPEAVAPSSSCTQQLPTNLMMDKESFQPEAKADSSRTAVAGGEGKSTHSSDTRNDSSSTRRIDLDSYAMSLKKVVTDLDLPVPITMGVIGRIGCGKREMLNKFASEIEAKAPGVRSPVAHFDPKEFNWVHKGRCVRLSFLKYMLMWFVLFILTNVAIIFGMLIAFNRLDKDFKHWWIKNFQPEKYPDVTTQPTTTPNIGNMTVEPTAGSIIQALEDHVAIPILRSLSELVDTGVKDLGVE